jgi:hypothetical protein
MAVLLLGVLLLLIGLGLDSASRGNLMQRTGVESDQAFYLAEAGRQRCASTLAEVADWPYDGVEFSLGGGSYVVNCTRVNDGGGWRRWTITSTGYVPNRARARSQETVTWQVRVRSRRIAGVVVVLGFTPVAGSWRRS